ncbi:MAG: type 4a pilus biogenesis protein PilO [Armatimonadetes bacterium]|nr:type 4a pilus biogenesis protein PilO [Armatimonadota bacterium]
MKTSMRERKLVALCVVVVAFIGVPSVRQIRVGSGGADIADLGSTLNRSRQAATRLRKEIAVLDADARRLTWREDPEALPPALLKALDAAASGAGVTLTSFRPGRVQTVPGGSKLPITVQVRAPFPKAAGFLQRLQDTQERVALERVQIAATEAGTDVVAMELRLAVYSAARAQAAKPQEDGKRDGRTS